AAIALAAVACTDSTTPHGTPARPSFWGGGGTPACFRVTGGGRIDKPEPSTPYPQSKNKDHDFATFGFQARPTACNSTDGAGEIEWVDHSPSAAGHGFTLHGTVSSSSAVRDHYYPARRCGSSCGTARAKPADGDERAHHLHRPGGGRSQRRALGRCRELQRGRGEPADRHSAHGRHSEHHVRHQLHGAPDHRYSHGLERSEERRAGNPIRFSR